MKYDYVSVKINLYDKDDNLIGNTLDVASNLSPGEKWKFKASVTEKGFQKYKVTEISGN
jgi:hypothetical protein